MRSFLALVFFGIVAIVLLAFANKPEESSIYGKWVRDSDALIIEIDESEGKEMTSYIVYEGTEKFPCEINEKMIYKNIIQRTDSLWTCDFLLVTLTDCSFEYDPTGKIRLTREGKLEILCPGYKVMYYSRRSPRFDG